MRTNKIWTVLGLLALAVATLIQTDDNGDQHEAENVQAARPAKAKVAPALVPHQSRFGSAWFLIRTDLSAVLKHVYKHMDDNRILVVAAGVVFYGLLAIFPAVTAFVSLYGLMADPSTI